MKSINEKAKEVQIGYDDIQAPAIGTGFVTGTNYAIAKAVEWLKDFCNEHYIMSYADSSEVETEELIEIFKKKMEE